MGIYRRVISQSIFLFCVFSDVDPGDFLSWAHLDPRIWGPRIEHLWALFNFVTISFALLCLAYYFFNILPFIVQIQKFFSVTSLIWFLTSKSLFLVLVSNIIW